MRIEEVPAPTIGDDQVLIEVKAIGSTTRIFW